MSQTVPSARRKRPRRGVAGSTGGGWTLALALSVALVAGGCGDDGVGSEETVIELENLRFNPASVTVDAGQTVRWEWAEDILHNVKGPGFDSGNQQSGTFEHRFEEPGAYEFRCDLHSGMEGTVEVRG
jgi:plastocyanin